MEFSKVETIDYGHWGDNKSLTFEQEEERIAELHKLNSIRDEFLVAEVGKLLRGRLRRATVKSRLRYWRWRILWFLKKPRRLWGKTK
jgi:hypothetical protein